MMALLAGSPADVVAAALAGLDETSAAISLAMPSARFSRDRLPVWGAVLISAAAAITEELAAA